jgi:hypothetical protein
VQYICQERCYYEHKNSPEIAEDLVDIVAAGAQNSEDCIACRAFEWAACQSTVSFLHPISASMALRLRNSFAVMGVMPLRVPLIRTRVRVTPWPRNPRLTTASEGRTTFTLAFEKFLHSGINCRLSLSSTGGN